MCLGCYVVSELVFVDALLLRAAVSRPHLAVSPHFVGRCACLLVHTYLQAWQLVVSPLGRVVGGLQRRYGAAGSVAVLPRLPPDDRRLHDDVCAVCLTPMDVDRSRVTPCGHAFHAKCLELSLRVSRACPICRRRLVNTAAMH